jgi:hypothetical protein
MAVTIGVDDVVAGTGVADAGHAIGRAGTPAQPVFHILRGQRAGQAGEELEGDVAHDLAAAPVRRSFEGSEFHLAGDAQAGFHLGGDDLEFGHHHRRAGSGLQLLATDHGVVTPLALQLHAVTGLGGQGLGARAGSDHGGIAGDLALFGQYRLQAPLFDPAAAGAAADAGGAAGQHIGLQRLHVGARILAVTGLVAWTAKAKAGSRSGSRRRRLSPSSSCQVMPSSRRTPQPKASLSKCRRER